MNGNATVKVFNLIGQEVATLFNGMAQAGTVNSVRFDAKDLPSGMYLCTLRSGARFETRKMMLLK